MLINHSWRVITLALFAVAGVSACSGGGGRGGGDGECSGPDDRLPCPAKGIGATLLTRCCFTDRRKSGHRSADLPLDPPSDRVAKRIDSRCRSSWPA